MSITECLHPVDGLAVFVGVTVAVMVIVTFVTIAVISKRNKMYIRMIIGVVTVCIVKLSLASSYMAHFRCYT